MAVKHDEGTENYVQEIKEEIMEDDDGMKVEQVAENQNEVGKEESGEQLDRKEAGSENVCKKKRVL